MFSFWASERKDGRLLRRNGMCSLLYQLWNSSKQTWFPGSESTARNLGPSMHLYLRMIKPMTDSGRSCRTLKTLRDVNSCNDKTTHAKRTQVQEEYKLPFSVIISSLPGALSNFASSQLAAAHVSGIKSSTNKADRQKAQHAQRKGSGKGKDEDEALAAGESSKGKG